MPNFDSGATCGDDEKDAYFMAQDYIGIWLYEYYMDDKKYPEASRIEDIEIDENEGEFAVLDGSFKMLVGLDIDDYLKSEFSNSQER